jgi:hypothetical protein
MTRKLFLSILVIFITTSFMFLVGCNNNQTRKEQSSVWIEYGRTDDGDVLFYNKKVNTDDGKGKHIVQVWGKEVYSEMGREKYLQNIKKKGWSTEGWNKILNLSYINDLVTIDCKKYKSLISSIVWYDKDGNVLYSGSVDEPKWEDIIPDSTTDSLRKKICK